MFPQRGEAMDYEPAADDSIAAMALRTSRPPLEMAYDVLAADAGMLCFPLFNFSHGDLVMVQQLQTHPRVQMGLSDAGAHCGAICDGGMPTFVLTHWPRDRRRGAQDQDVHGQKPIRRITKRGNQRITSITSAHGAGA